MKYVYICIIGVVLLFGYGFGKSKYDLYNGVSIIGAAFTINGMNPITAEGYRVGLGTSDEWNQRIWELQKDTEELRRRF